MRQDQFGGLQAGTRKGVTNSLYSLGYLEGPTNSMRGDQGEGCIIELPGVPRGGITLLEIIQLQGTTSLNSFYKGMQNSGVFGLWLKGDHQMMAQQLQFLIVQSRSLLHTITDDEVTMAKNCQELLVYHESERQSERIAEICNNLVVRN